MAVDFMVRTADPAALHGAVAALPTCLAGVVSTAAGPVLAGAPDVVIVHCARGADALRDALESWAQFEIVAEQGA